jgi:ribosomal protein L40E
MEADLGERRCPNCRALVSADASWCGQCFVSLERPKEQERPPRPPATQRSPDGSPVAATWPCVVCGERNPIEADACTACGTPFATMMRVEPARDRATPRDAVAWSLIYPGLGHRKAGVPLDGLARGILFTMTFGMALLIGLGGVRSGPIFALFLLYLVLALTVYGGSAYEAHRVAQGGALLVPSRPLMWATVGLMLLSVVSLAVAVATATAR